MGQPNEQFKKMVTIRLSDEMEVEINKVIKKTGHKTGSAFAITSLKEYLDNSFIGEAITSERSYIREILDDVISEEHSRIEKIVQAIEEDYIFIRENEDLYD